MSDYDTMVEGRSNKDGFQLSPFYPQTFWNSESEETQFANIDIKVEPEEKIQSGTSKKALNISKERFETFYVQLNETFQLLKQKENNNRELINALLSSQRWPQSNYENSDEGDEVVYVNRRYL